jgi:hypothetical protein
MIKKIITQYNDRNSVYGGELTNHLNMGLYALYCMGADEQKLHDYAKSYLERKNILPQPPAEVPIHLANYEYYLGHMGYYSSFIPFFTEQIEILGTEETLRKFLNRLIDGSAGGAFHGIIRTAYAYELGDKKEIAKSLAYFSECYQAYPINIDPQPTRQPLDHIKKIADMDYFKNFVFKRSLITGRMMDIYEDPIFHSEVRALDTSLCDSETFADMLLTLYGMTEDFTMLHGFTSTHAVRVLKEFFDDYTDVLKQHWIHLQLAYLSTGSTPLNPMPQAEKVDEWDAIFGKALEVKDVHTIKLIYSLYEQSRIGAKEDRTYRLIAQQRVDNSQ